MKTRVISALLLISASGGVAYSEEQTPRLSWKGWFAGAHTGGFFGKVNLSGTSIVGQTNGDVSGFIGGPIGGYNFRHGNWVFGVEADISWTNASGTGVAPPPPAPPTSPPPASPPSVSPPPASPPPPSPPAASPPPPPSVASTAQYRYDINRIAHVRGRVGHLVNPNLLVYVAGGLAIADIDVSEIGNASGWNGHVLSGSYVGWTIGAGFEYALCDWASARLEYLYDDFGSRDFSHGTHHYYNVRAKGHIIRAAINVHFKPEDLF